MMKHHDVDVITGKPLRGKMLVLYLTGDGIFQYGQHSVPIVPGRLICFENAQAHGIRGGEGPRPAQATRTIEKQMARGLARLEPLRTQSSLAALAAAGEARLRARWACGEGPCPARADALAVARDTVLLKPRQMLHRHVAPLGTTCCWRRCRRRGGGALHERGARAWSAPLLLRCPAGRLALHERCTTIIIAAAILQRKNIPACWIALPPVAVQAAPLAGGRVVRELDQSCREASSNRARRPPAARQRGAASICSGLAPCVPAMTRP